MDNMSDEQFERLLEATAEKAAAPVAAPSVDGRRVFAPGYQVGAVGIPAPSYPTQAIRAARSDALEKELGVTGLDVRSGRIYEEYNLGLQSLSSRMRRYEEMRRSDSAIAVVEALISLPIRAAQWRVEPGDDVELAERVERNLMDEMSHNWDDLLREVLLAPLFGFAVHEIVWERKADGWIGFKKFAERARTTVDEWQFDRTGGLKGLIQRGLRPDGTEVTVPIPIEKLMVWSWRKECGNPEGLGVLRQAYKAYSYKEAFEEFAAIRIERQACGIPVATPPEWGATDTERAQVLQTLYRQRTGEDAGLIVPNNWMFEFMWPGAADVPFESHIERQHQYILQTILGQFVGYAQGGDTGAWSLSRDASSIFLFSLNTTANWITNYFNRYTMPRVLALNAGDVTNPPRLVHGPVGLRDLESFGRFIESLFGEKTHIPEDVQSYLREEAGLPAPPPGEEMPTTSAQDTEEESDGE